MNSNDHTIVRGDYAASIPAPHKALQAVQAARAAARLRKLDGDGEREQHTGRPHRRKQAAHAERTAHREHEERTVHREQTRDELAEADPVVELQARIRELERLQHIVESMCVFTVQHISKNDIRYKAHIRREEVERLLHYVIERTRKAGLVLDARNKPQTQIAHELESIVIE